MPVLYTSCYALGISHFQYVLLSIINFVCQRLSSAFFVQDGLEGSWRKLACVMACGICDMCLTAKGRGYVEYYFFPSLFLTRINIAVFINILS